MTGAKSSASALPEHAPCAGEATGFAVAVTVGIGAMRCDIRTRKPWASRRSCRMAPTSKRSPSANRTQVSRSAATAAVSLLRIDTWGGHQLLEPTRRAIEPWFVKRSDDLRDQAILSRLA